MDYSKLEELVAIEKKSNASKEKREMFCDELLTLLKQEGFSNSAQKYIKSGFSFCGAKPLALYIASKDDTFACLKELITTDMFKGNENKISHKIAVSLFEFFCNGSFSDKSMAIELINQIPVTGRDKNKKYAKDVPKIFEKYFVSQIKESTALPNDFSLESFSEKNIREYMQAVLPYMIESEKINDQIKNTVNEWANESFGLEGKFMNIEKNINSVTPHTKQNDMPSIYENNEDTKQKSISMEEIVKCKNTLEMCPAIIDELLHRINDSNNATKKAEKRNKELNELLIDLNKRIDEKNSAIKKLEEKIAHSDNVVKKLESSILDYQRDIRINNNEINTLKGKLDTQNSVISVYSADKEKSESEILNAIASKLKSQFKDFNSARNESMSEALGENFRYQIEEIFKILKKSGIDVEGR